MPLETTPRTGLASSVMPVPGMYVPIGAKAVTRPARAFGAPQTISSWPSVVSTWQTCSLSAFGCFAALMTRATVNGA